MSVKEISLRRELVELAERQQDLDRRIADALNRKRFSADPGTVAKAEEDERTLLTELDRLLTRTRAVEGQLLQIKKRRERQP